MSIYLYIHYEDLTSLTDCVLEISARTGREKNLFCMSFNTSKLKDAKSLNMCKSIPTIEWNEVFTDCLNDELFLPYIQSSKQCYWAQVKLARRPFPSIPLTVTVVQLFHCDNFKTIGCCNKPISPNFPEHTSYSTWMFLCHPV